MKRKLSKRNKEFMSKLLKGKPIGAWQGKYIFKRIVFYVWRNSKPESPLQYSYTIWKFRGRIYE